MWLENPDIHAVFCFDLEFLGDITADVHRCRIWEIGCVCMATGETYRCSVRPMMSHDQLWIYSDKAGPKKMDASALEEAVPLPVAIELWSQWMRAQAAKIGRVSALLVSHNCFRSDLPVLSCEMGRVGSSFYVPTFFFDSLLLLRYALRGRGLQDFSLQGLSQSLTRSSSAPQSHRALSDALRLASVLTATGVSLQGLVGQLGYIPLTALDGIGVSTCTALNKKGILSVRMLAELVLCMHGTMNELACHEFLASHGLPRGRATARSLSEFCSRMGWYISA